MLDPPRNPRDVGWWQRSARPGATAGQTVLTGHTVHTGGGVMDHLSRLRSGQIVKVVTRKGTMVYRTTKVVTWTKDELARRAVELFGQERERRAPRADHLQPVDRSGYKSNVVVFADPLGVRDKKPVLARPAVPVDVGPGRRRVRHPRGHQPHPRVRSAAAPAG